MTNGIIPRYFGFSKFLLASLLTVLLLAVSPLDAHAILYDGIRPLGMGNAFTAISDDENAVFYNPAGLSQMPDRVKIGLVNPRVGVASDTMSFFGDASDTDFDETAEVADLLRQYTGKPQHFSLGFFPHLGFNMFDASVLFGVLAHTDMDIEIRNPVWPESHINLNGDIGPVMGGGMQLPAVEGLSIGMGLKYLYRKSLNEIYTPAQIASDTFDDTIEDDMNSGSGVSLDIGAIYELPDVIPYVDKTSIGLAGLNLPDMSMGSATRIKHQFNTGIAVEKAVLPWCTVVGAFDIHDITYSAIDENQLSRRIHIGAEFQIPVISLRTGINDGYVSAGGTIDLKFLKFDVATYAVEQGAYAGQKDDRRYLAQVFFGW